ncbi:hypothetical protein AMECASPLE_016707 [Ameca splendens]|uniref:Uncharacterized protein n=1 Tax=Ameca splendens TaxID=208324 RepID=A0ABV0XFD3_9TELE
MANVPLKLAGDGMHSSHQEDLFKVAMETEKITFLSDLTAVCFILPVCGKPSLFDIQVIIDYPVFKTNKIRRTLYGTLITGTLEHIQGSKYPDLEVTRKTLVLIHSKYWRQGGEQREETEKLSSHTGSLEVAPLIGLPLSSNSPILSLQGGSLCMS